MSQLEALASRMSEALGREGYPARLGPRAGDYGQKILLHGVHGALVVYLGNKGPRIVRGEIKGMVPDLAQAIDRAWSVVTSTPPAEEVTAAPGGVVRAEDQPLEAWVDGACISQEDSLYFGWAVLVCRGGHELYSKTGTTVPEGSECQRNVAAEIAAVMHVLEWCQTHRHASLVIHHDYEGLEAWVTGRWRTGNVVTSYYAERVRTSPVGVKWTKVKAHAGVANNERVDRMARDVATSAAAAVEGTSRSPTEGHALPSPPATGGLDTPLVRYVARLEAMCERRSHYPNSGPIDWQGLEGAIVDLYRLVAGTLLEASARPTDARGWLRLAHELAERLRTGGRATDEHI